MKTLKTMMVIGCLVASSALADDMKEKARKVDALYKQGLIAMNQGKGAEAEAAFKEVLKLHPGHGHARHHLKILPAKLAQVKQQQRESMFKTTVIREINFNKATLAETLEALELFTAEATDKKFAPNFVIQDPTGKLSDKMVTLKMKKVPLSAILQYLTQMTDTSIRYDSHATVVRPAVK
ncbi:MAG: tetratricopeptide repeat protein [Akkermansiaceae bacterium]